MRRALQSVVIIAVCVTATVATATTDRVALVLSMADYQTIPDLDNTHNDAEAMARTL